MPETRTTPLEDQVLQLLKQDNAGELTRIIDDLTSKEIVHLMGHLSRENNLKLLMLLDPEDAAELMEDIPEAQAIDIIEEMEATNAAAILNEMESDTQADLIMELDDEEAQAILAVMDPEEAEDVRKRIQYEYDTAGGLMRTEYFAYPAHQTVEQVTEDMRANAEEYSYYLLKYIFVISRTGKLTGVLQMQDLLLASPGTRLSRISIPEVLSVDHQTPLEDLITFFDEHELFGVPVTNENGVLLGVVLRRDILEAENERVTQELLETQGIVGGDELRSMPVWLRARRRLSWLSVNILLNIIAASVIAYNQDILSSVIALAVFLPIISDMSGCSGNQAVAVSLRELALGLAKPVDVVRVWAKEVSVGVINGVVLGILIAFVAWIWKGNPFLGLVIGLALALNTVIAVSVGGVVPLLLKRFNQDPAVASGPLLTTITDVAGFFLVLSLATWMMPLLV